jgi:hypothetical protein
VTAKIKIPKGFPIRPLKPTTKCSGRATCGTCGLSWDDSKSTGRTPTPSGRCPFEAFHPEEQKPEDVFTPQQVRARMGVEVLEEQVIALSSVIRSYAYKQTFNQVPRDHLGTLHANLVVLRTRVSALVDTLAHELKLDRVQEWCPRHGQGDFTPTEDGLVCDRCSEDFAS